jgi:hypothetical protein
MHDETVKSPEVTLRDYILDLFNERDRKYEQRFGAFDKSIDDAHSSIKEVSAVALVNTKDALTTVTSNTREALATANSTIHSALMSLDKRFDTVNEFRGQLADQQALFARKTDIEQTVLSLKDAVTKAENATEKRFDSVNEFRAQMGDMQATLVRKSEVDIRFESLEKKLDTAVATLQMNEGRKGGQTMVVGLTIGAAAWVIAMIIPVVLHFLK